MSKQAKVITVKLPLVRVMIRKRKVVSKWETHKAKVGRVFNVGKFMIATFPKHSKRCPSKSFKVA